MMKVNLSPPRLTGTAEQKLSQLDRWLVQLCEQLNMKFNSEEKKR